MTEYWACSSRKRHFIYTRVNGSHLNENSSPWRVGCGLLYLNQIKGQILHVLKWVAKFPLTPLGVTIKSMKNFRTKVRMHSNWWCLHMATHKHICTRTFSLFRTQFSKALMLVFNLKIWGKKLTRFSNTVSKWRPTMKVSNKKSKAKDKTIWIFSQLTIPLNNPIH